MQIVPGLVLTANISSILGLYFLSFPHVIFNFLFFCGFFFPSPCVTEIKTEVTEAKQWDIFILNSYRENCRTSEKAKCVSISIQFSFNWLEFHLFSFEWSSETQNTNGKWLICISAFLFSQCFRYLDCCRRNGKLYVRMSSALWVASEWQIARAQEKAGTGSPYLATSRSCIRMSFPGAEASLPLLGFH